MTVHPRPLRLASFALALAVLAASTWGSFDAAEAAKKRRSSSKAKPAAAAKGPARVEIAVLHTTDLHGHLLPWDYAPDRPDPDLGLSKIATLVKQVRAETPRTILVDAGDCIQGTPLSYVHAAGGSDGVPGPDGRPDPQMACMNAMGYDAFAIGNHEYNFGLEVLRKAQSEADFPWLSANTLKTEPAGAAAYQSYVVKEFDGVRVGILGLTTPGIPSWDDPADWAGLRFEDPLETARRMVPIMREAERCDAVIVVCHMGLEEGEGGRLNPGQAPNENRVLAIARGVPGIDAIVMGHTHARVESRMEKGVLLTQSGRFADGLGRIDLTFDRDDEGRLPPDRPQRPGVRRGRDRGQRPRDRGAGQAVPRRDRGLPLDRDRAVRRHARRPRRARARQPAPRAPAARADRRPSAPRSRCRRCSIRGRASSPGPVTVRDAFEIYPYENHVVAIELSGADLKAALEHASRYYMPYDFGRTGGPIVDPDARYTALRRRRGRDLHGRPGAPRRRARARPALQRRAAGLRSHAQGRGERLPAQRRRRLHDAQERPRHGAGRERRRTRR